VSDESKRKKRRLRDIERRVIGIVTFVLGGFTFWLATIAGPEDGRVFIFIIAIFFLVGGVVMLFGRSEWFDDWEKYTWKP